jgi:heat-inducible transcriptional repressor
MLSNRQETLLEYIIKDYTETAKPISSGQIVGRNGIDLSPATIRNDMAALEEAGYLHQPHTSAGRIPTEAAWRWFVQRVMPAASVGKREREHLETVAKQRHETEQDMLRKLAKALAEIIDEAVIVAFDRTDTYYTGLSNLFSQPEFADINVLQNLSKVVDHLDDVMANVYTHVGNDVRVMVGKDNPFSATCGTVIGKYSIPRRANGVIGFLGPLRQDYNEHMALMRFTQSLLQTV